MPRVGLTCGPGHAGVSRWCSCAREGEGVCALFAASWWCLCVSSSCCFRGIYVQCARWRQFHYLRPAAFSYRPTAIFSSQRQYLQTIFAIAGVARCQIDSVDADLIS